MKYKACSVQPDSKELDEQLGLMYGMADSSMKHYNECWWGLCCPTLVRNTDLGTLGHAPDQVVPIRKFFKSNGIDSLQKFKDHMKKTLPRRDDGTVFLPQVNMEHPEIGQVKMEEEEIDNTLKLEEDRLQELRYKEQHDQMLQDIIKRQTEQEAKFDGLLKTVNEVKGVTKHLMSKVKQLETDIGPLLNRTDQRDTKFNETVKDMDALKANFTGIRHQISELDFKVAVLCEDIKFKGSTVTRQISTGLQYVGKYQRQYPDSHN